MSEIRLFLLGAPRIERDGSAVDVDTRKAIALVGYLAVEAREFRRDSLAALLWPEHGTDQARGALRRTMSTLKKAMGGEGLQADRATVALTPGLVCTDAIEFRNLVERSEAPFKDDDTEECLAVLRRALPLYRGDFLAGFSLRDSVEFEDWQYYQSESHKRLMATALERSVDCLTLNGSYGEAIEHARKWLSLDPLHEPAHRVLMLLYAWNDQRSGALKQYRECVALLDRELGVPPLDETTELYRNITDNRVPAPRSSGSAPEASVEIRDVRAPAPPPLVGRRSELEKLNQTYSALGPSGHVVLIEGEAGIGKSRLADEVLKRVRSAGGRTAVARCHSEETRLPFGAVSELLRSTLETPDTAWLSDVPAHWLSECARLLPELLTIDPGISPPARGDDPGAQARFFEAIATFLTAACAGRAQGAVVVDDLQWADESSLDVLLYLTSRLATRKLLIVGTFRSEEVASGHRVRRLLPSDRSESSTHIVLDRLSRAEVAELVGTVRPDDADLSDRLFEETEGLPFFVVEYLAALEHRADPASPLWSAPSGVRELLSSRLERLNATARQVLTSAAVIGRSFDFDTAREAGGRSEDETLLALDDLAAAGLVKEVGGAGAERTPVFDFSHEGIRKLVLDETSTARLRLLHRRVAESLVRSRQRAGAEPGTVAHHYEAAGDADNATVYYERAGQRARSLFAHAEALAHYEAALALGHGEPARIHEAMADISILGGDYTTALARYETAAALTDQHDLVAIEHKIGVVHQRRGDLDAARSHLEVALELLDEDEHGRRARVCADLSLVAHRRGDGPAAERLAGEALTLTEKTDDVDARAQVHNILGILAKNRADISAAIEHLEQSADLAATLSDPTARIAALNNLALAHGQAGDGATAIDILQEALKLCAEQQDRHREAALHNNLADLFHRGGDRERSMAHLKSAVAIFAEIGSKESTMQPEIWKLIEW